MSTYRFVLTGQMPLIMHKDNLTFDDKLKLWQKDPANKALGKDWKADDRCPGFRWIGYLYHAEDTVVIPSDNLMTCLREGGAKVPTGKRTETFKKPSQSGIVLHGFDTPLLDGNGNEYKVPNINDMFKVDDPNDFHKHQEYAEDNGFWLFIKRAKVQENRHVRVRPRFENWMLSGTFDVIDSRITKDVLVDIFKYAGTMSGLCDWRPGSPKAPGPYGRFTTEIEKI